MEGPPGDRGVNYRTLAQLFQTVEARRQHTDFSIYVSLLEVSPPDTLTRAMQYNVIQLRNHRLTEM